MNPARTHSSTRNFAPAASLHAQTTGRALWQQRSAAEQRQAENDLRIVERHLNEARKTLAALRAQAQTATDTTPNTHEYSDAMLAEYAGMQLSPARQVSAAEQQAIVRVYALEVVRGRLDFCGQVAYRKVKSYHQQWRMLGLLAFYKNNKICLYRNNLIK